MLFFSSCFSQKAFFEIDYKSLLQQHNYQNSMDYSSIPQEGLDKLYAYLQEDYSLDENSLVKPHHLINVYNFLVIYTIKSEYPISSVKDVPSFFDKKHKIGDKTISLDKLETYIVNKSANAFCHVLLNCGAKSCPILSYLDSSIALDDYITDKLKDENILSIKNKAFSLSKIFYWHQKDFGNEKEMIAGIQQYFADVNLNSLIFNYKNFDWSLNDLNSDDYLIYYPTKLYKKGGGELKIFNNYYTQTDNDLRSNFFSSFFQFQFGTNKNFNWGFDVKFRSVNQGDVGLFSALELDNKPFDQPGSIRFSRTGISGIGPRIKYQPFKSKPNINFLHSIYLVPLNDAEGNIDYGYSDFQNLQVFNNIYIEKELSFKRRLFFDIGLWVENIDFSTGEEAHFMQIQLPVTAIYSYFPSPKTTFYTLINISAKPVYTKNSDLSSSWDLTGYGQLGGGFKYYLTDFLETELLYSYFYDGTEGRQAHTFNIGLRFFRF